MSARQSAGDRYSKRERAFISKSVESELLNARLNASETMLRGRIGDVKVNKLIEQFMAAGMADPTLFKALYAKHDPYRWLAQHWAPKQHPSTH